MNMKKGKDCQELLTYLSDYIDDNLDDDALCENIEQHVESCENCRIVVDTLKKTLYLYQASAEQTVLPDQVRDRLYQRLDLEPYLPADEES